MFKYWLSKQLKKILIFIGIIVPLASIFIAPASAQNESAIATVGAAASAVANETVSLLEMIVRALANIIQPDNTKTSPTPQLQTYFAGIGAAYLQNVAIQNNPSLLLQLTASELNQPLSSFSSKNPVIASLLPNLNSLIYSSMLGIPPVPKPALPPVPLTYIENAGALNAIHIMPGLNWQGQTTDQQKYYNFYSTIMAIESFDGYVLSHLLANTINNNSLTPLQNALITQVTSSNFIAQIASETIGQVLRQLLIFTSQSYVLLTQMVNLQREQLTAQVMTNSLLILSNQQNETLLADKAQGIQPTP